MTHGIPICIDCIHYNEDTGTCAAFPVEFGPQWCHHAIATLNSGSDYLKDRRARYLASPLADLLRSEAAKYQAEPVPA